MEKIFIVLCLLVVALSSLSLFGNGYMNRRIFRTTSIVLLICGITFAVLTSFLLVDGVISEKYTDPVVNASACAMIMATLNFISRWFGAGDLNRKSNHKIAKNFQ